MNKANQAQHTCLDSIYPSNLGNAFLLLTVPALVTPVVNSVVNYASMQDTMLRLRPVYNA